MQLDSWILPDGRLHGTTLIARINRFTPDFRSPVPFIINNIDDIIDVIRPHLNIFVRLQTPTSPRTFSAGLSSTAARSAATAAAAASGTFRASRRQRRFRYEVGEGARKRIDESVGDRKGRGAPSTVDSEGRRHRRHGHGRSHAHRLRRRQQHRWHRRKKSRGDHAAATAFKAGSSRGGGAVSPLNADAVFAEMWP